MTAKYHINLFWSEPDGAWVADVPDLESCAAFGDTPAEALAEVETAMAAWLAVARGGCTRGRASYSRAALSQHKASRRVSYGTRTAAPSRAPLRRSASARLASASG
jgi:predicted RNase H-like HicB family nuclease